MADSFIKEEALSKTSGLLALNWRMFRSFPLFLRLLPLTLIAIVCSSATPSVFRWYSGNFANTSPGFTLRGLVLVTLLGVGLRIAAWALFEISGMWSSQRIHAAMVQAMARTRTTFFDENPSGRLINRLVRDFDEVRSTAIIFVGDTCNATVEILSIAVVAWFASPWAAILILPLLGAFSYVQYHRSGMLDHSRGLSAIATSHVMSRKNDLIEGRETFLLYNRAEHLLQRIAVSYRKYIQAAALTFHIEIWASFWIRVFSELFSLSVLLFTTVALANGDIEATLAGVIISSLFGITASVGWLDFATSLVSRSSPHIRRVFEIADLPPEETEEKQAGPPSLLQPWKLPDHGEIVFIDYTMSYRKDTPEILRDIYLQFPLGSKIAIVGRTGSGKTSVMQALLRMVYVRKGDIRIAGRSIFDIDLRELRKVFGVVPQSPYLFGGTIRSNLDRVGSLSPRVLEDSLRTVGLFYPLDHVVSEGGQNLSVGERQLVCLARVIAADRKIILMDEPTSGLDPETDARINTILTTALRDKTVITIAHRRESLGGYDRIIEIQGGAVVAAGSSD
jgi:ATP-binding cassette, subfamily C (CFTR/MRP), member 1